MSNELIEAGTAGSLVTCQDRVDPFAVVFEPARPTLLAVRKLQPLLTLIGAPMLNLKQPEKNRAAAIERYELIPEDTLMYGARKLRRRKSRRQSHGCMPRSA